MSESNYEIIHTITDWYDGAREGIADFKGEPHYYQCHWDEESDEWSEIYVLSKIDDNTFNLAMEDWHIWLNWENAFRVGNTSQETHPALPEDKERHKLLAKILKRKLICEPETSIRAKGEFKYGKQAFVKWTKIS